MTNTNSLPAFLVAVCSLILLSGCGRNSEDYEFHQNSQELEDNTPPFNPTYFKDSDRQHMAVFFNISNGMLSLSNRPAEIRPGDMPYHTATGGNVLIIYKDADGKELGRYAIEDPVLARSCDFDDGAIGELRRIPSGTTEILLPYNENIASIDLGRVDGKLKTFSVARIVKSSVNGQDEIK